MRYQQHDAAAPGKPEVPKFHVPHTMALLAAGLLALVAIVAATLWIAQKAGQNTVNVSTIIDVRLAAVGVRNSLLTAESSQRGFLYSGNEIYLAPFEGANADAVRQAAALTEAVTRYPDLQPLADQLNTLVEAKVAEMSETVSLKREAEDIAAMDMFLTNRGKALMDQVNVFVVGITDRADERLISMVREQERGARLLTWISLAGALFVMLVVAATVQTFVRSAREIAGARDEVRAINESLERRVEERTSALTSALERAELLLAEVNHRVSNSLAIVASLVRLQARTSTDPAVKNALAETHVRITAVAAVHKRLYTSGDVTSVALDEYLSGLLQMLADSMHAEGNGAALRWDLDKATLSTDASVNVGIVVTELVTNAYKYAYPDREGEIWVRLRRQSDRIEISVEDEGIGRGLGAARGTGLGSRIISSTAATIGSEVLYVDRERGTLARLSVSPVVH